MSKGGVAVEGKAAAAAADPAAAKANGQVSRWSHMAPTPSRAPRHTCGEERSPDRPAAGPWGAGEGSTPRWDPRGLRIVVSVMRLKQKTRSRTVREQSADGGGSNRRPHGRWRSFPRHQPDPPSR